MSQETNTYFGTSVIVLVVVGALVALILNLMSGVVGGGAATADMSAAAVEARIKPVGQMNTGAPIAVAVAPAAAAPAAAAARSGEAVYNASCVACHSTGAAGAPKLGDKAAWGDRIAQGMDTLVQHSIAGFQGKTGVMPPRGTCGTCSDGEMKAAVEFMVSKAK